MSNRNGRRHTTSASWDAVAEWYAGWVGPTGSEHHRGVAIPALLELLAPAPGERILDVGCGTGAVAPHIASAGASYTGIDASERMIRHARRWHGARGRFIRADAAKPDPPAALEGGMFDAAAYLLSIQDIEPLDGTLRLAGSLLRPGGRVVLLMTHPCFRVPRQSGWGWDAGRKLQYRRVDHYLTPLPVPMKRHSGGRGATRSYHRPLQVYVDAMAAAGLLVERVTEIPYDGMLRDGSCSRAQRRAAREIPLFLGIRAVQAGPGGQPARR